MKESQEREAGMGGFWLRFFWFNLGWSLGAMLWHVSVRHGVMLAVDCVIVAAIEGYNFAKHQGAA